MIWLFLIIVGYLWGFVNWQNQYFVHYLKRLPSAWPDFRPVALELKKEEGEVCVDWKYDQPYIMTLFYLQYPPEKIQKEISLTLPDEYGFSTVRSFGNYQFGDCSSFSGKIIK